MNGAEQDAGVKIRQREAFYCNMKLLLIFMVVYGHLLEGIMDNAKPLIQIYRIIYSVHMPLFLFLSGLFLKNRAGCARQMNMDTPVWHLWHLLS